MENQNTINNKLEKKERVSIFIDGSNFYHGVKILNVPPIDFKILLDKIVGQRDLEGIYYYTAQLDPEFNREKYVKHEHFLFTLRKITKMKVVLCNLKKIWVNGKARYEIKQDDICLAKDMIVGAYEKKYETAILISGDEDFIPVVRTLQGIGKKVENIYFRKTSSRWLRTSCDIAKNIREFL